MTYKHWNDFVNAWKRLPVAQYSDFSPINQLTQMFGWYNPNRESLMNSNKPDDYSFHYLPEPWWGNDGNYPLNSVVINYNPGWAESYKHFSFPEIQNFYHCSDYSTFVHNQVTGLKDDFPRTNNWHLMHRAQIVFNTLERIGVKLNGDNQLINHLSIELIPWHTTNIRKIENYINRNLKQVYTNSLVFAAEQSRRIQNSKLRNKVIVRLGGTTTINFLKKIQAEGIANYQILNIPAYTPFPPAVTTGDGGYLKFVLKTIPDVEFISIWGRKSRNKFPSDADMDWIFMNII